jgi:hypothetical protein
MCSVCHKYLFLFYYFKCWQLVSAWIGHQQATIYKNNAGANIWNNDQPHGPVVWVSYYW